MSDLISRQAAISAICNACGKIDCDKTDKCEKLQLPPANNSEIPNSSDTISRKAAIEALDEQIRQCDKALSAFDISMKDAYAVKVERASLVAFRETLEYLPPAQPERKKGKWIYNSPVTMKCDQCGLVIKDWDWNRFKYCPNCCSDMRGEQND